MQEIARSKSSLTPQSKSQSHNGLQATDLEITAIYHVGNTTDIKSSNFKSQSVPSASEITPKTSKSLSVTPKRNLTLVETICEHGGVSNAGSKIKQSSSAIMAHGGESTEAELNSLLDACTKTLPIGGNDKSRVLVLHNSLLDSSSC